MKALAAEASHGGDYKQCRSTHDGKGALRQLAEIVVAASGVFLIGLGSVMLIKPAITERFITSFASSRKAHFLEMSVRLLFGISLVVLSMSMWQPTLFRILAWAIIGTAPETGARRSFAAHRWRIRASGSMKRFILLTLSAATIFVGFGLPFIVDGRLGLVAGGLVVLFGAGVFWLFEMRTKASLEQDSAFNRLLKSDGENLIERSD